ncbi:MAG: ParB/RepB/Spo0J family partition protein, partial [Planctomycetes bacterium]|nr:ParB/RepB/Spo0J family partition protein [Planctomycetota bacterium]
MSKDRRLGRGLAALLGAPLDEPRSDARSGREQIDAPAEARETVADADTMPGAGSGGLLDLNVYEIDDNPFQPRRDFSEPEIVSLAESLKEHDMLQPILVRRVGDRYQLISGERRLRAAIQAGWSTVPARLREADDRLVAELAIVENLQRKDLNPVEKALSFKRYLEEHECSQEDLARRLKIDRS